LVLISGLVCAVFAQSPAKVGQTLIVIPFDNASHVPGLEWIGDAFPEMLEKRLSSPSLYVLGREDRLRAYEQLGLPADAHPSRATIYRISEQLDLDYVVMGRYSFDARQFTVTAQLLDMQHQHLFTPVMESAPLVELMDIQTALAWDLLRTLRPTLSLSKQAFTALAAPIRLDAFENYIRGVVATSTQTKVRYFREAVRITPNYTEALLALGKTYFSDREYEEAISWLERVPRNEAAGREASFFLALAAYYQGDFAKAESALNLLVSQMPLLEVYNNLGVVAARRGESRALEYLQKAVDGDPSDPDYHFNLGGAYYRAGDMAKASEQLREALTLKPADADAKALLDAAVVESAKRNGNATAGTKIPMERMKRNYDENSFRQLALEIQATAEERLSKKDAHTHAQYHVAHGQELLRQGFVLESENEFREAISLDQQSAEGHSGLARVLEAKQDSAGARTEAASALHLKPFAEPLLVLGRLDLRENKAEAAADSVNRALQIEPSNGSALALKRAIAAKLAEKAQPLPNQ
jgi:tetratricopeptide (TPR) repeat protein